MRKVRKSNKMVYGVGINDANYTLQKDEIIGYTKQGKRIRKVVWRCPFYSSWCSMLQRAYSQLWKEKHPSYEGCSTVPEWHYFMTFRDWMDKQDWQGKELDKDILFPGNKIYGPETCVFVDGKVNRFILEGCSSKETCFVGIDFKAKIGKYRVRCCEANTGNRIYLGLFDTKEEGHNRWLQFKLEQAKILAAEQTDLRIAKALIDRYENFNNNFGDI